MSDNGRVQIPELDGWKLKALTTEVRHLELELRALAERHRLALERQRTFWRTLAAAHGLSETDTYRLAEDTWTLERVTADERPPL
jgi:hypothetical protein